MTTLDPARYKFAVLADPTDRLPLPDRGGRLFMSSGEYIDTYDATYAGLLADGSLRLVSTTAAPPASAPATFTQAQLDAAVTAASASLQATIGTLQAQLAALQNQIATGGGGTTPPANTNTLHPTFAAFGLLGAATN